MNQLENKVILVTGGGGFIGAHLVERLCQIAGVKLLLLSRHERQSSHPNVVWLAGELCQLTQAYWQAQGVSQIDYVFHLGAFTPKATAEANCIKHAVEDNILGTHILLQGLPGKVEKLIFSSTLDVYAQTKNGEVLTEDSAVKPGSLYGSSKLFDEDLICAFAKENACDYAILRYGHIYGPGEEQYAKFIPTVIRNLLAHQAPILYGDGSALRDYFYVGDAVEATIRSALVEGNLGPLNIVRGESVTLKEIAQLLIRLVGTDLEIQMLSDKPNGNSLRFNNRLMVQQLGRWPLLSLEEGLAAEVAAFKFKSKSMGH